MQSGFKEELIENQQWNSGVPSERLVESWALQERLRRWRYEFSWQFSGVQLRVQV
jgi:hypothetical protein